jgi:acetyl-CoA carboxylase carboxyltransferase component
VVSALWSSAALWINGEGKLKSFTHMPRVTGYGKISGRLVCVDAADFTIRGGWADPTSFASIGGLHNHD